MLSMVCFYGAAAPHLRAKEASMRQLHSLILAKSSRALNQLTGMPATRCMTTSQLSGPAAAQQAAPATVRPHVRRSRRLLVPLTAAAASLAAGGGVALLIACDFDQVLLDLVMATMFNVADGELDHNKAVFSKSKCQENGTMQQSGENGT